ncbi:MAG: XdhC family protein [Rhodothermia bacterium]|nr:XdhC family protein [Rhodothermia bacterium]
MRFWSTVDRLLRAGENVFVAFVVQHTLHSPGTTGARLLVSSGRTVDGTIGGGAMEFAVVNRAHHVVSDPGFEPEIHHLYHREDAPGETSGMICAGEQINVYCVLSPSVDGTLIEKIADAARSDRSGAVTIDASGLSFAEGNAESAEPQYVLEGADTSEWMFREQLLNLRRVAIMGGGHCGLALSRLLYQLGFEVTLYETRKDVETFVDNTFARSKTILPSYEEAAERIEHTGLTDVVVMTTDFPSDVAALKGIATTGGFRSVGLMGSPAKIHRIQKELRASGVSHQFVDALRAPVGLPIHSNTPEEIAVSVAAQIVQDRNAEEAERLRTREVR